METLWQIMDNKQNKKEDIVLSSHDAPSNKLWKIKNKNVDIILNAYAYDAPSRKIEKVK